MKNGYFSTFLPFQSSPAGLENLPQILTGKGWKKREELSVIKAVVISQVFFGEKGRKLVLISVVALHNDQSWKKSCLWSSPNRCEESLKRTCSWDTSKEKKQELKKAGDFMSVNCPAKPPNIPTNIIQPQQLCHCSLELLDPKNVPRNTAITYSTSKTARGKLLLAKGRFSSPEHKVNPASF